MDLLIPPIPTDNYLGCQSDFDLHGQNSTGWSEVPTRDFAWAHSLIFWAFHITIIHKVPEGQHERFQSPSRTRWPSSTPFSPHHWPRRAQQMAIAVLLARVKAGPGPPLSSRERASERRARTGSSGLMLNFTPDGLGISETCSWWTGRWRWRVEGWSCLLMPNKQAMAPCAYCPSSQPCSTLTARWWTGPLLFFPMITTFFFNPIVSKPLRDGHITDGQKSQTDSTYCARNRTDFSSSHVTVQTTMFFLSINQSTA